MSNTLRIELTPEEQGEYKSVVALEFEVSNAGGISITQHWGYIDELYGDGCVIFIPGRVWALASVWIAARLSETPNVSGAVTGAVKE